jgi:hypothetical protein
MSEDLAVLIKQYALDLRRNASGGDDYPYDFAKGVADYLGVLIKRANGVEGEFYLVPREIIDQFPEININNYDHDDACALNAWGCEVVTNARTRRFPTKEAAEAYIATLS